MFVCMYACMHVCMYVCMYVCTYSIYIYTVAANASVGTLCCDYSWLVEKAETISVQHGREQSLPHLKKLFRDTFVDKEVDVYRLLLTFAQRIGQ